jgi:hypothetical protein
LKGQHSTREETRKKYNGGRPDPDDIGLGKKIGQIYGWAEEIRGALVSKQGVVLNRTHDVLRGILDRLEGHLIAAA